MNEESGTNPVHVHVGLTFNDLKLYVVVSVSYILDVKVSTRRNLLATASSFLFEGFFSVLMKLGGKLVKCPENGRKPQKLGSSGSAFPLDNPKNGKTLISSIFRRISRRMKVKVTSKRKFTRKAGSAAKTEGPMAEWSRPSAPTSGTETSGKAGAGPLGKAESAGTEATAAEAVVTLVTAVDVRSGGGGGRW